MGHAINIDVGRHALALADHEWGLRPLGPELSQLLNVEPVVNLDRRWYVVQTHPQQEPKVVKAIAGADMEAYHPQEPKRVRVNPVKHRTVMRPMLTGYVFVSFDLLRDGWMAIPCMRGVLRLFMVDSRPLPVPLAVIQHIMLKEQERSVGRCANRPPITLAVGVLVRILEPFSFAGLFGFIVEVDQEKHMVRVEVDIFGRLVPIWLPPEQVEPV